MDISYLKNYQFNKSVFAVARENRNIAFCKTYFLKLISKWNEKLPAEKQLIKSNESPYELQISLNNKPFLEIFYGSARDKINPYVSLGLKYDKVYSLDNIYDLIKLLHTKTDEILSIINEYDENFNIPTNEANCCGCVTKTYVKTNKHILQNIEKQMYNYLESHFGSIENFWSNKSHIKKLMNISGDFCARFFASGQPHLQDILEHVMTHKENEDGYLFYMTICKRYGIRLDYSDYDFIAKKFHQDKNVIYDTIQKEMK